jgi:hypothetical protein
MVKDHRCQHNGGPPMSSTDKALSKAYAKELGRNRCPTNVVEPLSVTFPEGCRLTGFSRSSLWKFAQDGRLKTLRVPGCDRTLIEFQSLKALLQPTDPNAPKTSGRRGRPKKRQALLVQPEAKAEAAA